MKITVNCNTQQSQSTLNLHKTASCYIVCWLTAQSFYIIMRFSWIEGKPIRQIFAVVQFKCLLHSLLIANNSIMITVIVMSDIVKFIIEDISNSMHNYYANWRAIRSYISTTIPDLYIKLNTKHITFITSHYHHVPSVRYNSSESGHSVTIKTITVLRLSRQFCTTE